MPHQNFELGPHRSVSVASSPRCYTRAQTEPVPRATIPMPCDRTSKSTFGGRTTQTAVVRIAAPLPNSYRPTPRQPPASWARVATCQNCNPVAVRSRSASAPTSQAPQHHFCTGRRASTLSKAKRPSQFRCSTRTVSCFGFDNSRESAAAHSGTNLLPRCCHRPGAGSATLA